MSPKTTFQSTLPRGERPSSAFLAAITTDFNPRSRVGSDDASSSSRTYKDEFQSTLPRGERRSSSQIWILDTNISIHAPAWGATIYGCGPTSVFLQISIHAPAWGATVLSWDKNKGFLISIHAPAWGATIFSAFFVRLLQDFNPRSRVGSDGKYDGSADGRIDFNPRSRVGSDAG